jgi:hypothetical protein
MTDAAAGVHRRARERGGVVCSGRAQQSKVPVIGFLNSGSPGPFALLLAAFHQGLKDGGYIEGQNVAIEHRWATPASSRTKSNPSRRRPM